MTESQDVSVFVGRPLLVDFNNFGFDPFEVRYSDSGSNLLFRALEV
jgi:hypothetical protein